LISKSKIGRQKKRKQSKEEKDKPEIRATEAEPNMSQAEIQTILKRDMGQWFRRKELVEIIKAHPHSIDDSLNRLRASDRVLYRRNGRGFEYSYKVV
jgi:hypothetical protein